MKRLLILALPILLTSCSYIKNQTMVQSRDKSYTQAKSIPPLKIPPGVSSSAFRNDYPISDRTYPPSALNVTTIPPGLMEKET